MIPEKVQKLAQERVDLGGKVILLGGYEGKEVYICDFEEPVSIGLPEVYLWDGEAAQTIIGKRAADIISALPD